jgi:hypothetical protein
VRDIVGVLDVVVVAKISQKIDGISDGVIVAIVSG